MVCDYAPDSETQNVQRRRRRRRVLIAGGAACLALLGVAVFVGVGSRPVPPPVTATPPAPPAPPPPVVGAFGKGRTFQDVLSALGVAKDRAIQIVQALRPHLDFRRLKPQDELELHHDSSGDLAKLVYRQSPIDIVEATRAGDQW